MSVEYTIEPDGAIVRLTISDVVALADLNEYFECVLAHEKLGERFVEIVDFEELTDFQILYTSANVFGEVWRRYVERGCLGSVFYASNDLAYGIGRMVQSIVENAGFAAESSISIVRDKAQAEILAARLLGRG